MDSWNLGHLQPRESRDLSQRPTLALDPIPPPPHIGLGQRWMYFSTILALVTSLRLALSHQQTPLKEKTQNKNKERWCGVKRLHPTQRTHMVQLCMISCFAPLCTPANRSPPAMSSPHLNSVRMSLQVPDKSMHHPTSILSESPKVGYQRLPLLQSQR